MKNFLDHLALPPMTTLRGFEAAARLGSFAKAADELHVTQSAVSHQIRLLERHLGQPLFRRIHRAIVLTDAGRDFARTVRQMIEMLEQGVSRLAPYKKPEQVILYTTCAFARSFVMPRLRRLKDDHPDIDLWLDTSERRVDFETDEVDLLITQEEGIAGLHCVDADFLPDRRAALAAPTLVEAIGGLPKNPLDLARWPLLHDESVASWREWFVRMGGGKLGSFANGLSFSDQGLMLDAVLAGHGAALVSLVLAKPLLDEGRLLLLPGVFIEQAPYRLYCDRPRFENDRVRRAFEWLRQEAEALSDEAGPERRGQHHGGHHPVAAMLHVPLA
jgi:LysR family transcriptional regulator, glycine cleavage system transcriptional activator